MEEIYFPDLQALSDGENGKILVNVNTDLRIFSFPETTSTKEFYAEQIKVTYNPELTNFTAGKVHARK